MLDKILNNINWTEVIIALFSIVVPVSLIAIKIQSKQIQKSGKNSTNYQANGNIHITGQANDKR